VIHIEDMGLQAWEFSKIEEKDSWRMQVVSYFFIPCKKNSTIFQSGDFVKTPTRSLDSS